MLLKLHKSGPGGALPPWLSKAITGKVVKKHELFQLYLVVHIEVGRMFSGGELMGGDLASCPPGQCSMGIPSHANLDC